MYAELAKIPVKKKATNIPDLKRNVWHLIFDWRKNEILSFGINFVEKWSKIDENFIQPAATRLNLGGDELARGVDVAIVGGLAGLESYFDF